VINCRPPAKVTTDSYAKYIGPSVVFPLKHPTQVVAPATSSRLLIYLETNAKRPEAAAKKLISCSVFFGDQPICNQ
jgi:hypothetical protein